MGELRRGELLEVQRRVTQDDEIEQRKVTSERQHGLGRRDDSDPVRAIDRKSLGVPGDHEPRSSRERRGLPDSGEHRMGNNRRLPPAAELGRREMTEGRRRRQHKLPGSQLGVQVLTSRRRHIQTEGEALPVASADAAPLGMEFPVSHDRRLRMAPPINRRGPNLWTVRSSVRKLWTSQPASKLCS